MDKKYPHNKGSLESLREKAHKKHNGKYTYPDQPYVNSKTKIKIICPKHGEFHQTPTSHLSTGGCKKCGVEKRAEAKRIKHKLLFDKKSKKVHGEKYDYSKVVYVKANLKVIVTCKLCKNDFEQTPNSHWNGRGCPYCSNHAGNNLEKVIKKGRKLYGLKYEYPPQPYINNTTKIKIVCPNHGVFWQTPSSHMSGNGCKKCGVEKRAKNACDNNDSFASKAKDAHGENFNYSKVNYIDSRTKVIITCNTCNKDFEQIPVNHIQGQGCPYCAGKKNDWNLFVSRSKITHNDKYKYPDQEYINSLKEVTIICPKHGEFKQKPKSHLKGNGCPYCSASHGEKTINKFLKRDGVEFYTQHRIGNTKFKYDFYLPSHNLLIEYDGKQHFEPIKFFGGKKRLEDTQRRDRIKDELAKKAGIRLLRIPYWDFERIEEILAANIGEIKPGSKQLRLFE